jgi:hypothetical protein
MSVPALLARPTSIGVHDTGFLERRAACSTCVVMACMSDLSVTRTCLAGAPAADRDEGQ